MEMNNIFEEAKFGDKFLTRDSKLAIFVELKFSETFDKYFARLMDEVTLKPQCFFLDGHKISGMDLDADIVSRYQEPINEDKLNKLAHLYAEVPNWKENMSEEEYSIAINTDKTSEETLQIDAYKAGYRKAMEE